MESLSTDRLEAEITTFAAHMTAAMCRWLLLVAEHDRRAAFERWECVSMAQWLGVHVGISSVTARQQVAVARQLVTLPAIREAFGSGEVSYSRVRAICRIATPTNEHEWVELARHATALQLERIVSDTIRCVNASDPERYDHELTIWAIVNRPRPTQPHVTRHQPDSAESPPKNLS